MRSKGLLIRPSKYSFSINSESFLPEMWRARKIYILSWTLTCTCWVRKGCLLRISTSAILQDSSCPWFHKRYWIPNKTCACTKWASAFHYPPWSFFILPVVPRKSTLLFPLVSEVRTHRGLAELFSWEHSVVIYLVARLHSLVKIGSVQGSVIMWHSWETVYG